MDGNRAQRQYQAAAGAVRVPTAPVCAKPTMGAWSITPFFGVHTDHTPEPRRLRVDSP